MKSLMQLAVVSYTVNHCKITQSLFELFQLQSKEKQLIAKFVKFSGVQKPNINSLDFSDDILIT